jgi:hypothetical protein
MPARPIDVSVPVEAATYNKARAYYRMAVQKQSMFSHASERFAMCLLGFERVRCTMQVFFLTKCVSDARLEYHR